LLLIVYILKPGEQGRNAILCERLGMEVVEQWGWVGVSVSGPTDGGIGGDDAADACRYLVATKGRELRLRKLSGL